MKVVVISAIPQTRIELTMVDPEKSVKEILDSLCMSHAEICQWEEYTIIVTGNKGVVQLSQEELIRTKMSDLERAVSGSVLELIIAPLLEGG